MKRLNDIQERVRQKMDDMEIDLCVTCGEAGVESSLAHYKTSHHAACANELIALVKETDLHKDVCGSCPALITTDELAWCQLTTRRSSYEWTTNLFGDQKGEEIDTLYPNARKEQDLSWSIVALRGRTCRKQFKGEDNEL